MLKNCTTCAHRKGNLCVLTGYVWITQRRWPDSICNEKLSGWKAIDNGQVKELTRCDYAPAEACPPDWLKGKVQV
jgi:hypothetical protein